jgi:hypothetical protein
MTKFGDPNCQSYDEFHIALVVILFTCPYNIVHHHKEFAGMVNSKEHRCRQYFTSVPAQPKKF